MKIKLYCISILWLLGAALSCEPQPAMAQTAVSGLYDVRLKELIGGSQNKLTDLRFGKITIDLDGFVGAGLKTQTPVFGPLFGKRFAVDSDGKIKGYAGIGLSIQGQPNFSFKDFKAGLIIGFGAIWKF